MGSDSEDNVRDRDRNKSRKRDNDSDDSPPPKKSKKHESEDEEEEDDEQFEVERIVDKREKKGKIEYQIKWKGYPDEDNSWEKADELDCQEKMKEYETMMKKKK